METDRAALFDSRFRAATASGGSWYQGEHQEQTAARWRENVAAFAWPPGRIVEFGCGTGENLRSLAALGWDVAGYDISETAISTAKQRASDLASWIVADLGNVIPATTNLCDVLIDGHCLHFMVGDRRAAYLRNAFGHLVQEGLLIVETNIGIPDPLPPGTELDQETRTTFSNGVAMNYWADERSLVEEITAAGFEVVRSEKRIVVNEMMTVWARKQ